MFTKDGSCAIISKKLSYSICFLQMKCFIIIRRGGKLELGYRRRNIAH